MHQCLPLLCEEDRWIFLSSGQFRLSSPRPAGARQVRLSEIGAYVVIQVIIVAVGFGGW